VMLDELITATGAVEWTAVIVAALVIVASVIMLSHSSARTDELIPDA
jgi:hypothetical protein